MATSLITPEIFNHFGNFSFTPFKNEEVEIISNMNDVEDKLALFKEVCHFEKEINILQFHNLMFHLTNQNPAQINSIIIELFNEITLNIQLDLQNKITQDQFNINYFTQVYNKYYSYGVKFTKHMSYFDKKVSSNKYSYIALIRNYTFYQNIINHKYTYNNRVCYLYEIFNHFIENNEYTMENILMLYKMYTFYVRFSHIKSDVEMFNQELNKLFLNNLGSNENFIKMISHYIHSSIIQLTNNTQNNNQTLEQNITNIIELVSKLFIEKDMFNMHYEKLLEQRLLSHNCNCDIEERFITYFERPRDNKTIQRMCYKLDDIRSARENAIMYNKLKINIGPDSKYKNKVSLDHFHNIKFKLFRSSAWTHTTEDSYNNMNIPEDLEHYFDIYFEFCKKRYPNRAINFNFNYGVGIIKITLGQKQYQLQVTVPQMFLLLQFNKKEKYTAIELRAALNIPMSKFTELLNGFLKIHIMTREKNKLPSDPTMLIYLNHDFKYDNSNISLLSLMNTPQKIQMRQEKIDADIAHKCTIERTMAVQAALVRLMKKNKNMNKQELLNNVKTICKFDLSNELFETALNECIKEKYMKFSEDNQDYFEYIIDT